MAWRWPMHAESKFNRRWLRRQTPVNRSFPGRIRVIRRSRTSSMKTDCILCCLKCKNVANSQSFSPLASRIRIKMRSSLRRPISTSIFPSIREFNSSQWLDKLWKVEGKSSSTQVVRDIKLPEFPNLSLAWAAWKTSDQRRRSRKGAQLICLQRRWDRRLLRGCLALKILERKKLMQRHPTSLRRPPQLISTRHSRLSKTTKFSSIWKHSRISSLEWSILSSLVGGKTQDRDQLASLSRPSSQWRVRQDRTCKIWLTWRWYQHIKIRMRRRRSYATPCIRLVQWITRSRHAQSHSIFSASSVKWVSQRWCFVITSHPCLSKTRGELVITHIWTPVTTCQCHKPPKACARRTSTGGAY